MNTSPATGLSLGWSAATVTWAGGSATISEILDVRWDRPCTKVEFVGDDGNLPQCLATKDHKRRLTIATGDVAHALAVPDNTIFSVSVTQLDLVNGLGTGAVTYQLVNAVLVDMDDGGDMTTTARAKLVFEAFAPAGIEPLTVTVAP